MIWLCPTGPLLLSWLRAEREDAARSRHEFGGPEQEKGVRAAKTRKTKNKMSWGKKSLQKTEKVVKAELIYD